MTVILSDTFTDTNGTAITAHTPEVGGAWSHGDINPGGTKTTATIESNRTYIGPNAAGVDDYIYQNIGITDFTAIVYYHPAAALNSFWSIVFRSDNNGNLYRVILRCGTAKDTRLLRYIATAETALINSDAYSFVAGNSYKITLNVSGSTFTLYIDDVLEWTYTDSTHSGTIFGLGRGAGDNAAVFDNLSVDDGLTGAYPWYAYAQQ